MAIKGARAKVGTITPHLVVRGVENAIDFYREAFEARELYRSPLPGGAGLHAHIQIRDTMVMLTDEFPSAEGEGCGEMEVNLKSPQSLNGTTIVLELLVEDVDAAFDQALRAGGAPTLPVSDTFWGDRYGWVTDPFGHIWALATVREELTPRQVEERMNETMATGA